MSTMISIRIWEDAPLLEVETVVLPDGVDAAPVIHVTEMPKNVTLLVHPEAVLAVRRALNMSFQDGAEADVHRIIAEIAVKTASDYDAVFALIADNASRSPEPFLSVAQDVLYRVRRDFGANGVAALSGAGGDYGNG